MKGIVFDFDDVLCDTKSIHKNAFKNAIKEFSYFWNESMEREYRNSARSSTKSKLELFVSKGMIRSGDANLIEASKRAIMNDMLSEVRFSDKYFKRLASLNMQHNLKLAVVSNSDRSTVISFLKWTRLNELVDYISSSADQGLEEPTAELFVSLAQKMNATPGELVAFQHSPASIVAAKNAGLSKVYSANYMQLESSLSDFEKTFLRI